MDYENVINTEILYNKIIRMKTFQIGQWKLIYTKKGIAISLLEGH